MSGHPQTPHARTAEYSGLAMIGEVSDPACIAEIAGLSTEVGPPGRGGPNHMSRATESVPVMRGDDIGSPGFGQRTVRRYSATGNSL
jgi:hypothetical protein